MTIRPYRDIKRKKTKKIQVGSVAVGGDSPISVQSMTNTLTTDVDKTIKQVNELEEAGADIVRISCPDQDSSLSLKKIIKNVNVPIVADIHFHYKRAIEAAKAGASCLRINPGNIGSKERVKEILKAAKDNNCSIRIGVNAGSLDKTLLDKYKEPTPDALVDFSNQTLLGVNYTRDGTTTERPSTESIIFDNQKFNQDIYLTHSDVGSSASINYYIELETVNLALDENTVATLKDIRNITQANE